jgi:hypothetical protein
MIQYLNNLTNIFTVILYISYSIIKRIDTSQFIVVALTAAWIINISLLIYSILKILSNQEAIEKSKKYWIYFRAIVNIAFLIFTIYLF